MKLLFTSYSATTSFYEIWFLRPRNFITITVITMITSTVSGIAIPNRRGSEIFELVFVVGVLV